jgi:nucleotide-binding universal stress UspA family protein
MFTRILTAIDDIDADRSALQLTMELARWSGAAVRLLHIDATDVVGIGIVDQDDRSGVALIDRAVEAVASSDVRIESRTVQAFSGDVPDVIARSAEDFAADLVVVAPHQRSRLRALLFPRVSDALAHRLQIPLLLVPAAHLGSREVDTSSPNGEGNGREDHRYAATRKDAVR